MELSNISKQAVSNVEDDDEGMTDCTADDIDVDYNNTSDGAEDSMSAGLQLPLPELLQYSKFFPELTVNSSATCRQQRFWDSFPDGGKGECRQPWCEVSLIITFIIFYSILLVHTLFR